MAMSIKAAIQTPGNTFFLTATVACVALCRSLYK
jgi:hypothetical protein